MHVQIHRANNFRRGVGACCDVVQLHETFQSTNTEGLLHEAFSKYSPTVCHQTEPEPERSQRSPTALSGDGTEHSPVPAGPFDSRTSTQRVTLSARIMTQIILMGKVTSSGPRYYVMYNTRSYVIRLFDETVRLQTRI